MFWSKLCKSTWNCAWNLAFPVFISPIVWNMCENLHYESVYFKELHNEQEYYWPTIYRAGAAVVSTITSCNVVKPAGLSREEEFSVISSIISHNCMDLRTEFRFAVIEQFTLLGVSIKGLPSRFKLNSLKPAFANKVISTQVNSSSSECLCGKFWPWFFPLWPYRAN